MRFRTAATAMFVLVLAGACGGGGDKQQAASDGGPAAAGTDTTSTTAAAGTASTAPPSGTKAEGAPGGAASTPTTAAPRGEGGSGAPASNDVTKVGNPDDFPVPMTVEAVRPCVRPGEFQTVVLRSEPDTYVGYDSVYSDGQNSMSAGNNYYGGSNSGETGPGTEWRDTFLVKVGAPAGEVRVNAVAGNKRGAGRATTTFRVADSSGKC